MQKCVSQESAESRSLSLSKVLQLLGKLQLKRGEESVPLPPGEMFLRWNVKVGETSHLVSAVHCSFKQCVWCFTDFYKIVCRRSV